MKSFQLKTFGCKTNQYEGEAIRELLTTAGFTDDQTPGEVFIINACSVTEKAEKEWLKLAKKVKERSPDTFMVLTGCFPADDRTIGELKKHFSLLVGFGERTRLVDLLLTEKTGYLTGNLLQYEPLSVKAHQGHTRAFLKIEDGCHLNCSYCLVPRLRGRKIRSKTVAKVKEELVNLVTAGFYEVVLTGTHLGAYGFQEGFNLNLLLKELLKVKQNFRLRLSSLEPQEVDEELLSLMSSDPRIARHLHLPLQSGSASILRAMNRLYSPQEYLAIIDEAATKITDIGISTDILVGYPLETSLDYTQTLEMMDRIDLVRVHLFPFSPRPGTVAYNLPPIGAKVMAERMKIAREKAKASQNRFAGRFLGKQLEVLAEKKDGNRLQGYSSQYLQVSFSLGDRPDSCGGEPIGKLYKVLLDNLYEGKLQGTAVS